MIGYNVVGVEMPNLDRAAVDRWVRDVAMGYGRKVGDINFIFVDDEEILRVNREFVHHDYYTDHIGFDYSVGDTLSGDVFVGVETVADNARLLGVEYMHELHRVMIHGVLHLCGMEDADPCQRARMQDAEDKALQRLACIGQTSDGAK